MAPGVALPKGQLVYFVRAPGGRVKVGETTNLRTRLLSLSGSSLVPLDLVGWVPSTTIIPVASPWGYSSRLSVELLIHRCFEDYRISGEWFAAEGEFAALVAGALSRRSARAAEKWLIKTCEARAKRCGVHGTLGMDLATRRRAWLAAGFREAA